MYEKFPQSWRVASTFWSTTWDRKWFYSGKLCTSLSGDVIYISTLDSGHVVSFQISSKHCTKITKDCLWAWQAGWSSYPRPLLRVLFLLENIHYPTSPTRVFCFEPSHPFGNSSLALYFFYKFWLLGPSLHCIRITSHLPWRGHWYFLEPHNSCVLSLQRLCVENHFQIRTNLSVVDKLQRNNSKAKIDKDDWGRLTY